MPRIREVTGRLENWYEHRGDESFNEFVIWGNIYDDIHNRWFDGYHIHTSGIPTKVHPKEGDVVQTSNSSYLLGKPRGEK